MMNRQTDVPEEIYNDGIVNFLAVIVLHPGKSYNVFWNKTILYPKWNPGRFGWKRTKWQFCGI